jgi:hypothetical protein
MAERLAAANGGNGGWSGAGSKADKQTAQLKTLLGVETPPQFGNQQNNSEVGSNRSLKNPAPAKKSLMQIQNEEVIAQVAREQAAAVGRVTGGGPKAGSWGAVAASGGQQRLAPASMRQQQPSKQQLKASPIQTRKQAAPQRSAQVSGDNALWDYQEDNTAVASTNTRTQSKATPQAARAASANAKDFGGAELPPGMSQWASGELQKLKGDRDLTLVHFCMTLQASADIREYMREFLGSTPEVSSFASEFIKRKRAAKKSKKGGKR